MAEQAKASSRTASTLKDEEEERRDGRDENNQRAMATRQNEKAWPAATLVGRCCNAAAIAAAGANMPLSDPSSLLAATSGSAAGDDLDFGGHSFLGWVTRVVCCLIWGYVRLPYANSRKFCTMLSMEKLLKR